MEPRIQYAKTSDGVSIAASAGGGQYVIMVPSAPQTHVSRQWHLLSAHLSGAGLSQSTAHPS